jgi:hypothetical protein
MFCTSSQASIKDDMATSLGWNALPSCVRLVKRDVICCAFRKSMSLEVAARGQQAGHRIDDDDGGPEGRDLLEHRREVHLQSVVRGPRRVEPDDAALDPGLEAQPDGMHVADDLVG